ncbi:MAG: flagellar hook-length control protein FliK, partial [Campylobacterota bacterium]|nr:flagellar hook-length control protein FliK [Campylobacterota bacterium]
MIVANAKSAKASSSSSPLSLSTPKDKPILSFSDLLRGAGDKKDEKLIQNGSLVLALESEEKSVKTAKSTSSKTDSLLSLLKNEENLAPNKSVESLELNPKLTAALSTADIKTLVSDAKIYLKSKIQESEGYKKAELKELPNTLKGLVEVAKKFNIDISKITFEEVRSSSKNISQILGQEEIKAEASKEALQEKKELKTEMPKETLQEKKELKSEMPKTETPREVDSEKKELKTEMTKT